MRQDIDPIEVTEQEAAAIAAHVDRLREGGETELTAAALLARMTHKVARSWADQVAEADTSLRLQEMETKLRTLPPDDRTLLMTLLVERIDAALPESIAVDIAPVDEVGGK